MEQVFKSQLIQRGMSLIELMTAMALLIILATLALPNYFSAIKTVRMHGIQNEMLAIHMQQQAFLLQQKRYAQHKELLVNPSNYYELTVTLANEGFLIVAQAKQKQKSGTVCDEFTLDQSLQKTPKQCWTSF